MIRVLLADDHPIVRAGLCRLVEESGDIQVVAEADDGHAAIQKAQDVLPDVAHSCTAKDPNPPDAPQTSTLWPGRSTCGRWPNSMRYAVASVSV